MNEPDRKPDRVLAALRERAKELDCLYRVEQILSDLDLPVDEAFRRVVESLPAGWQHPDVCRARVEHGDRIYATDGYRQTRWSQDADILAEGKVVGRLTVCYLEERLPAEFGPFLAEEERLIRTVAERLGQFIGYQSLRNGRPKAGTDEAPLATGGGDGWRGAVELLRRFDRALYLRAARRMVNYLCWAGVDGAQELLRATYGRYASPDDTEDEANLPRRAGSLDESVLLGGRPFELAAESLGADKVLRLVEGWIAEDRVSFLSKVLNNPRTSLGEVLESLRRFHSLVPDGSELSPATVDTILVSLIRRFLTEQLDLITVAKRYLDSRDFIELLDRVIISSDSHGRLGGKSAELFLAERILRAHADGETPVGSVKVPRSWYIPSEEITTFLEHNNLEEVLHQKYKEIEQVRHEYPNIVRLFKNSRFPQPLVRALSMVLDEVGESPIIVRSSSLLEDRLGSAFSGKYRSLFLANQGSKRERLAALMDAITEVYASLFGPDPIAYRREKGLTDFHEKMAVLIQEVVGTRVGDYFFPALAGVAYSNNELRWSPRIRREDGLIRLVPGLGTRAVERTSNDYPILVVPGQPGLRVNATIDEAVRYSPRQIDVLDLAANRFETHDLRAFLAECGADYPAFERVFSIVKDDTLQPVSPVMVNLRRDELVADFNGLISHTPFVRRVGDILKVLQEGLGSPVDIEFAHDGTDLYLLQCRAQSHAAENAPAAIPRDVPDRDTLFFANRFVSNGWVPDITHIVYVHPEGYAALASREDLVAVGRAVGQLNKLLPKRRFILMGPGRWGSRGDIRLGVSVGYADINHTAVLIEIARRSGSYVPDLSFGTHFFQDLVESEIRYLPLYPDEAPGFLNVRFLLGAPNLLPEMLPAFAHLAHVVRVIDVPEASRGRVLRVLMNADLDEAIGVLADPSEDRQQLPPPRRDEMAVQGEEHWRWRMRMAETIARSLRPGRFGVHAIYVIGSTKNANAGPASDIDLVVHFRGDESARHDLETWLQGWSLSLGEINYLRTGYVTPELLDIHIVTDDDIERKTSYAARIGAVTDAALELPLGRTEDAG